MNPNLPILANFKIASPCDASWEEMTGDDEKRFCGQCEKHVYNLPLLTPDQLVDLIERTEGKFCGRLYARRDGTVLTDDCPIGLSALARARRKKFFAAGGAIAALCFTAGAAVLSASWGGTEVATPRLVPGEIVPIEQTDIKMGKIAYPEDHLERTHNK